MHLNVLAMEYPGYGISDDKEINDNNILIYAERVYSYLLSSGIKEKNIFIMGRSIGSGPAVHICSKYSPGGLILICPYTSISDIIKDKAT